MRRRHSTAHAFTLIELLVVIVILGILMAVAVPTFLRQQTKAQDSRTQQYLTTAFKAIRASTPDTNNLYPASTSLVSWVKQSEPELSAARGDCLTGVTTAPQDQVLVDPSSSANALTLCARSQSGNVWKLTASATSAPSLLDGTLVPLTITGSLISDTSRAANTQGDGRTSDSSTGIWEGTTNLIYNGGFETGTGGWTGQAGGTITQDGTKSKFGSKSAQIVTPGSGPEEGGRATQLTPIAVSANTTYTYSAWVTGPAGAVLRLNINEENSAGTLLQTDRSTPLTLVGNGVWQRLTTTRTMTATTAKVELYALTGLTAQAITFWVDGVQFEQNVIATPYVDTQAGSASRTTGRVQAPISLLNLNQGWFAARVRLDWNTSDYSNVIFHTVAAFSQADSQEGFLLFYRSPTNDWRMRDEHAGASAGDAIVAATITNGDVVTVIGTWTSTQVGVSVGGSAFTTQTFSGAPTPSPLLFDIGNFDGFSQLDGDMLWFAAGTGTLTNADAATINSWGSNDPKRSNFPAAAQATLVWDGSGTSGSLK